MPIGDEPWGTGTGLLGEIGWQSCPGPHSNGGSVNGRCVQGCRRNSAYQSMRRRLIGGAGAGSVAFVGQMGVRRARSQQSRRAEDARTRFWLAADSGAPGARPARPGGGLLAAQHAGAAAAGRLRGRQGLLPGGCRDPPRLDRGLAFLVPADAPAHLPILLGFLLLQPLRYWIIATLGSYWTHRVITLPRAPVMARRTLPSAAPPQLCCEPGGDIVPAARLRPASPRRHLYRDLGRRPAAQERARGTGPCRGTQQRGNGAVTAIRPLPMGRHGLPVIAVGRRIAGRHS